MIKQDGWRPDLSNDDVLFIFKLFLEQLGIPTGQDMEGNTSPYIEDVVMTVTNTYIELSDGSVIDASVEMANGWIISRRPSLLEARS